MSWTDEDRSTLGKLEAHAEFTKEGISEIKDAVKTLASSTREDIKDLYNKNNKAHERIDDVHGDFKAHKAKVTGFAAAISAVWAIVMGWVKD